MVPSVKVYSPLIIRKRVDFPVPFKPIRPILSFGLMCQLAFLYKNRPPNSNPIFVNAIINVGKDKAGN
jgi:hypothetical protein